MAEPDTERIEMEIEARLRADAEGTLRAAVDAGIGEQLAVVDAALGRGAPPAEYQRLAAIKSGLESAKVILERTWNYFHR